MSISCFWWPRSLLYSSPSSLWHLVACGNLLDRNKHSTECSLILEISCHWCFLRSMQFDRITGKFICLFLLFHFIVSFVVTTKQQVLLRITPPNLWVHNKCSTLVNGQALFTESHQTPPSGTDMQLMTLEEGYCLLKLSCFVVFQKLTNSKYSNPPFRTSHTHTLTHRQLPYADAQSSGPVAVRSREKFFSTFLF